MTGDNGLFTRANQARQNTLDAQNAENLTLEEYEYAINDALDGLGTGEGSGETITGVDTAVTNPAVAMPTGATVIEGDANEGIVIQDENEWVWVEVPKSIYDNAEYYKNGATKPASSKDYTNIEKIMQNYAGAYREEGYEDTFYPQDQAGFADANAYNTAKNNMLKSVYENGGFWIGRYEVGIENSYRNYGTDYSTEHPITETPVIKANAYPYNYVRCSQAQTLSQQLSTRGKTSSLMFGIQWDLICKFLEEKGGLTQAEIKGGDGVGSTNWGNYSDSTILLSQGKYNIFPDSSESQWLDIAQGAKSATMLLTTGASEDTKKMNIYDFAGNECEFTLEYTGKNDTPCSLRGGGYTHNSNSARASAHHNGGLAYSRDVSFRPSLY